MKESYDNANCLLCYLKTPVFYCLEPLRQNLEIVSLFLYYFVFYLTGDDSNN